MATLEVRLQLKAACRRTRSMVARVFSIEAMAQSMV
jgi:hypothetical protein